MKTQIEKILDSAGKVIQLHDVLRDDETGEMVLVEYLENVWGVKGLGVVNDIAGLKDWLDVYPNGHWTIVGNLSVVAEY